LFTKQEGKERPKVIAMVISYWWGFTGTGITSNVFAKDRYWFYFRDMKVTEQPDGLVANTDLKRTVGSVRT